MHFAKKNALLKTADGQTIMADIIILKYNKVSNGHREHKTVC